MLVIPVIDLLNGQVVRAIGGRRHEYQPWLSPVAGNTSQLDTILEALCGIVSHRTVYVADLDAITAKKQSGRRLSIPSCESTCCLLDVGFGAPADLSVFVESLESTTAVIRPVLSSESVRSSSDLPEMVKICQSAGLQPVLSLDLKHGRPVASCDAWRRSDPLEIVDCAAKAGLSSLIVLDLADVGEEGGGSSHELCREIRQRHPMFELIAGGGIRSYDDCRRFADAGCEAVLVATALHTGKLSREDCNRLQRNVPSVPLPRP